VPPSKSSVITVLVLLGWGLLALSLLERHLGTLMAFETRQISTTTAKATTAATATVTTPEEERRFSSSNRETITEKAVGKNADDAASARKNDDSIQIKIPYPVFSASLYKSGTTTIHEYFKCGGQKSVHFSAKGQRTGPCLQRRIRQGLHPVFQGCGGDTFDIYSDNAYLNPPKSCFDPSVHGLDAIYESYPNGTILMAVRDRQAWFDSVDRYRFPNWALLPFLKSCPDLWPTQQQDTGNRTELTDEDILNFYDWHTEHVRNFAKQHPSMTYIEVTLESNQTASILEEAVGIPASCWGHSNVNKRIQSTKVGV